MVWQACGANDDKFSKCDGMEEMVFITLLFSVLFCTCHLNLLFPCLLCALVAIPSMPTSLVGTSSGEKDWNAPWTGTLGGYLT